MGTLIQSESVSHSVQSTAWHSPAMQQSSVSWAGIWIPLQIWFGLQISPLKSEQLSTAASLYLQELVFKSHLHKAFGLPINLPKKMYGLNVQSLCLQSSSDWQYFGKIFVSVQPLNKKRNQIAVKKRINLFIAIQFFCTKSVKINLYYKLNGFFMQRQYVSLLGFLYII